MTYQAHNGYQCISDGRIGGNPLVFVEAKNPCNPTLWYVPGTHHEDPLFNLAPTMAAYARAHRTNYWMGQYPQRAS
jgi:hypothetical protein